MFPHEIIYYLITIIKKDIVEYIHCLAPAEEYIDERVLEIISSTPAVN